MGGKKQNKTTATSSPEYKLTQAIRNVDFDSIEHIISSADDDKRKALLWTGLRICCKSRNADAARHLIDLGADVNHADTRHPSDKRYPPLLAAVHNSDKDMVELLLGRTAEIDIKNEDGRTALMFAVDSAMIELLHRKGADLEAQDVEGNTALLLALKECRKPEAWQALLKCGADIRAVDYQGRTVLMTAAWRGNVQAMQDLIARGIDINKKDKRGRSILHHLATDQQLADESHLEMHKHRRGWTGPLRREVIEPIFSASVDWTAQDETNKTCLHWAAMTGSSQLARMMLNVGKVKVDAKEQKGRSALHLAASRNNCRTLAILLEYGADPNLRADGAWTPLHVACNADSGAAEAVRLLVEKGADPNRRTGKQLTALHIAAQAGNGHAVEYLIQLPAIRTSTRDVLRKSLSLCASNLKSDSSSILTRFAPWSPLLPDLPPQEKSASETFNATIVQFGRPWDNSNYNIRNCSVFDLLYRPDATNRDLPWIPLLDKATKVKGDADKNNSSQGPSTRFKWVHLPANNVAWCTDFIQRYFIEAGATDAQSFKDWERSFGHQRQGKHVHSRFMNPACQCILRPQAADKNKENAGDNVSVEHSHGLGRQSTWNSVPSVLSRPTSPWRPRGLASHFASDGAQTQDIKISHEADITMGAVDEDIKEIGSMYLFLPYLHLETFGAREDMQDAAERTFAMPDEIANISKVDFSQPQNHRKKAEPGEVLFRGYLNDAKAPLHMRRTLDQFMYHNINTRSRDRDQVMLKYQAKYQRKDKDENKLLMVDQLWMWVLSDDMVVTAFPGQWQPRKYSINDVHTSIIQYIRDNKTDPVNSVFELAMIITCHCLGAYDLHHDDCRFLHMFDAWIGEHVQKQINLFHSFIHDSEQVSQWLRDPRKFQELQDAQKKRRSRSRWRSYKYRIKDASREDSSSFLDNLMDVRRETALLKEIMDIRDELNMLALIFQHQAKLLPTMRLMMRTICRQFQVHAPGQQRLERVLEDHKRVVHHPQDDIRRMQEQVEQTYRSIRDLLDLKQQHANAIEARYAREQTEGTSRQGKTLMVFTVVTVIFLPLSFIAAFFTIEIVEFPHTGGSQELPLSFVSSYLFGIGIPLAITCVCIAWQTEWLGDQVVNLLDWMFGKDPRHAAGQLLPTADELSAHALSLAAPGANVSQVLSDLRKRVGQSKEWQDMERG